MKKKWLKSNGFTLAELLIVVAIIAVLVAISIPIFTTQLEKAREATDLSDVRSAYAEVMMAAITDDTTATYSKDSTQTIHKSNGLYSVDVYPLHQEKNDWQGTMDLNVGGVSSSDSSHWIGTPQAKGSCEVSYNPQGDAVTFNWLGKSNAGSGSGTDTGNGGNNNGGNGSSTGGGSTPAPTPNPGNGGGTTGGGDSTQGNTSGSTDENTSGSDQGISGSGDSTGGNNNNQGNTDGSNQENTDSSNTGKDDSDQSISDKIMNRLFKSTPEEYPGQPTNDSEAFDVIIGNLYLQNGVLYVAKQTAHLSKYYYYYPEYRDPWNGTNYMFVPINGTVLTSKNEGPNHTLASMNPGDIYYDDSNDIFYVCLIGPTNGESPLKDKRENVWVKINLPTASTQVS